MSDALRNRVARLEHHHGRGDWRQFGNDPRDYPDWALEMAVREEIEEHLKLAGEQQPGSREIADARALLEAGDFHRAVELMLTAALSHRTAERSSVARCVNSTQA